MISLNKYRKNLEIISFLSTYDRVKREIKREEKITELLKHREIGHYIIEQWVIAEIKKKFLALYICMGWGKKSLCVPWCMCSIQNSMCW